MIAQIATLEGDHQYFNDRRYIRDEEYNPELMGGLLSFGKSIVKTVASPLTSAVKGTGHFVMEAGRGIKTGDIGRIAKSPFKGAGHVVGSQFRDVKSHAEYYWRPSKMKEWMSPVGTGLMAAAPFTGPLAPFLLGGGALLMGGGALASNLYAKDKAGQASDQERVQLKEAQKKSNLWLLAGVGVLGASAFMIFK